eukprot:jgi/Chrzof1/13404/Cz07g31220.t1
MSAVLASDPSRGLFLKGAALDDCYRGPSHSQGVRNGHGTYVYPNRFYAYDGEYVEGKKHGHGRLMMADGGMYEGEFADDEIQGTGTRYFSNGNIYTGAFQCGMMHGTGTLQMTNGDVYQGRFTNNLFEGDGVYSFANGDIYEGQMSHHKPAGIGVMTYHNGNKYTGAWVDGHCCGQGTCVYANGDVYEGGWEGNNSHGLGTLTITGYGIHYTGTFVHGSPAHVGIKLNALYQVEEAPAGKGQQPKKPAAAGGAGGGGGGAAAAAAGTKDTKAAAPGTAGTGGQEIAQPLQVLPGQPFPVPLTVAVQYEAPIPSTAPPSAPAPPADDPQPQAPTATATTTATASHAAPVQVSTPKGGARKGSAKATSRASSAAASPRPEHASSTKQHTGSSPEASAGANSSSPAAGPNMKTVYHEPASAGNQWCTADMEHGRRVLMTLHQNAPQQITEDEDRVLSTVLYVCPDTQQPGEVCVGLQIMLGANLGPVEPLDILTSGQIITGKQATLQAGQHAWQPDQLVLGKSNPAGCCILDGGNYCLVFSSWGMRAGYLMVTMPEGQKGSISAAGRRLSTTVMTPPVKAGR